MSGTTADKLNYLKDTKELLRQEINNDFTDLDLTVTTPFRQYPSKINSSQLWMEAWIGGSTKLNASYDGTDFPLLFHYRYFDTLSLPNITTINFAGLAADTLTVGGPAGFDYRSANIASSIKINNLYVTNLIAIDLHNNDGKIPRVAIYGMKNVYLPSLQEVVGFKHPFMSATYALSNNAELYLPKTYRVSEYAINSGNLHIGTELSNTSMLTSSKGLQNIGTIYVPASLLDSYKTASNWSSYADKIVAEPGT